MKSPLILLSFIFLFSSLVFPAQAFGQVYSSVSSTGFTNTTSSYGSSAGSSSISGSVPSPSCVALTNNLYIYSNDYYTGGQVSQLQRFLQAQGYYTYGSVTGFFGPLTYNAVVSYQRAHGISGTGYVGPYTRASIQRESCAYPPLPPAVTTPVVISMVPTSGPIGTTVTLRGTGYTADNTISFGYGSIVHVPSTDNGTTLTFTIPSSLNPACFYSTPRCMVATRLTIDGAYNVSVTNTNGTSNSMTFTVTSSPSQTQAPTISTLNPGSGSVGTTVTINGSGFTPNDVIRFDIGTIHPISSNNTTSLTFTIPSYIGPSCPYNNPSCMVAQYVKQVTPGTYNVNVENAKGVSNTVPFTVTNTTYPPQNQPPTINSVSGPTQLYTNQTGTWSIQATDPSNTGQLTYGVSWGDENTYYPYARPASYSTSGQQTSTFTHSYSQPGTYTVVFTVTNASGQSAQSTITVNVYYGWTY